MADTAARGLLRAWTAVRRYVYRLGTVQSVQGR